MAKIHIPQVGDEFKIIKNWSCKVFNEYRNAKVFEALSIDTAESNTHIEITLPLGTVIRIERVYVRAPASSYDSVTLRIISSPIKSLAKARFWVKLSEINKLEFEEVEMNMDSYAKFSELVRFMIVSLEKESLANNLSSEDRNEIYSTIFNHFKEKNKNDFVVKMKLTAEEIISTFHIPYNYSLGFAKEEAYRKEKEELLISLKEISHEFDITVSLLPVLDKTLYYYDINEIIRSFDEKRGVLNKVEGNYWHKNKMGSFLSYGDYNVYDKKEFPFPPLLFENYNKAQISFNGEDKVFKDTKDFSKFFEKQRVKLK